MTTPTRDEVKQMAREVYGENTKWEGSALERLERFAHLVSEHRDKWWEEQVKVEVHEAVLDEREACAKVAEDTDRMVLALLNVTSQPKHIAAAIRARGQA